MDPVNSAIVGRYNSTKKLKRWKESNCKLHGVLIKGCVCVYNPPYRLLNFQVFYVVERKEKSG